MMTSRRSAIGFSTPSRRRTDTPGWRVPVRPYLPGRAGPTLQAMVSQSQTGVCRRGGPHRNSCFSAAAVVVAKLCRRAA